MKHVNIKEAMISYNYGNPIASFIASNIGMCYKMPKEEVCLEEDWLIEFKIFPKEFLKTWWTSRETFKT